MFFGKDFSVPVIQDVKVDSPAYKAGLKKGDQITSINDKTINSITEVSQSISLSDTNLIKITVLRDKKEFDFQVQAIVQEGKDNLGNNINRKMIGIQIVPLNNEINRQRLGPSKAIYHSLKEIWFTISTTMSYIGIPIVEVPLLDETQTGAYTGASGQHGDIHLTFANNFVVGVKREIQVYREFKPKKDTIEYTVFVRFGLQWEELDAVAYADAASDS